MLDSVPDGKEPEAIYNYFGRALDTALSEAAANLDTDIPEEQLPNLALSLGLRSYANQLACARILDILQPTPPAREKRGKR